MSDIVIVSGARTPMGGSQGSLASVPAVELGALAIREAVARAGIHFALDHGRPGFGFGLGIERLGLQGPSFTPDLHLPLEWASLAKGRHF